MIIGSWLTAAKKRGGGARTTSLHDSDRDQPQGSLVNCGRDTRLTFRDGSTILLMGVTEFAAVFGSAAKPPPGGRDTGGDR